MNASVDRPSEVALRVLVEPRGRGELLERVQGPVFVSRVPLSLWGGLDPKTGRVTDVRHPDHEACLQGQIWLVPWGRGSSSASSILLEAVKLGTAPLAILMREADGILALGAAVAQEMYGACPLVGVLEGKDWERVSGWSHVEIVGEVVRPGTG